MPRRKLADAAHRSAAAALTHWDAPKAAPAPNHAGFPPKKRDLFLAL
jgi:hypothetical protein